MVLIPCEMFYFCCCYCHQVWPKYTINYAKQDDMVYRIAPKCCKAYTSETSRPIQDRIIEHKWDVWLTIARPQAHNTTHFGMKFIDHDYCWYTCRAKEANHMRLNPNNINRDNNRNSGSIIIILLLKIYYLLKKLLFLLLCSIVIIICKQW